MTKTSDCNINNVDNWKFALHVVDLFTLFLLQIFTLFLVQKLFLYNICTTLVNLYYRNIDMQGILSAYSTKTNHSCSWVSVSHT